MSLYNLKSFSFSFTDVLLVVNGVTYYVLPVPHVTGPGSLSLSLLPITVRQRELFMDSLMLLPIPIQRSNYLRHGSNFHEIHIDVTYRQQEPQYNGGTTVQCTTQLRS